MKKSAVASSALAAASVACAQSSMTLFGVVDVAIQRISNSGGPSVTRLAHSSYYPSYLGFRGIEDLGGGMAASFWLEAGVAADVGHGASTNTNNQSSGVSPAGGLAFNRRSTVSLTGSWGEIRLGRDFTPQSWNVGVFEPFYLNGVGATVLNPRNFTGVTAIVASNTVGYFLPGGLGGLYGQAQRYLGENPSVPAAAKHDGNGWGVRFGYAEGRLNVAVAVSGTRYTAGNVRQNNMGASWQFSRGIVMGLITRDANGTTKAQGSMVSGVVPVGAGTIRLAYSQYKIDPLAGPSDPLSRKLSVGYVYNVSKRTAVYSTFARVGNSNGGAMPAVVGAAGEPAANHHSTGIDLGLRHSF